jgi:hypothetical protein
LKKKERYSRPALVFFDTTDKLNHLMDMFIVAGENLPFTISPDKIKWMTLSKKSPKDKVVIDSNQFLSAIHFMCYWQLVMIVTFAEAYLQDVLVMAAEISPDIMRDSKVSSTYDEIMATDSINHLVFDLRRKWASRNFIDSGPKKWIERLHQMGAKDLDSSLGEKMEFAWGVRHLIIHNANKITQEFVRIHKLPSSKIGTNIDVSYKYLSEILGTIIEFVIQTDRYIIKRFPALVSTE